MNQPSIKYLVLSDIHLGHPRNKTFEILRNLKTFFLEYHKEITECDMIFLAGDVFDRLLTTKSLEYKEIMGWLSNLLVFCYQNKIKLRILYGTPSHDCDQIQAFAEIAKTLEPRADFKYINTLDIELVNDLGISILYVPDEWRHDAKDTYKEVKTLLKSKGLSQVDLAIMHGCFRYQLPIVKDMDFTHNETEYLDIVKYYITIGHIHTASTYERILAPGSFDRLAHNEEENKGGIICTIDNLGNMKFKFLKNNYSKIFKTFNYTGKTEEEILKLLKRDLKGVTKDSYIRLEIDNNSKIIKSVKELANQYPDINIKIKTDTEASKSISSISILDKIKIETIEITPSNIEDLMLQNLNLTPKELEIFKEEMKLISNY